MQGVLRIRFWLSVLQHLFSFLSVRGASKIPEIDIIALIIPVTWHQRWSSSDITKSTAELIGNVEMRKSGRWKEFLWLL